MTPPASPWIHIGPRRDLGRTGWKSTRICWRSLALESWSCCNPGRRYIEQSCNHLNLKLQSMITWSEGARRYSSFKAFSKVSDSWSIQFNSGRSLTVDNGSCEFGWRILLKRCLLDHCLYPWFISICEGQVDVVDLRRTNWAKCIQDKNNSYGFNLSDCDSNSMEKPTIVLMSSAVSRSKCEEASSTFISVETQYSYTLCRSWILVAVKTKDN